MSSQTKEDRIRLHAKALRRRTPRCWCSLEGYNCRDEPGEHWQGVSQEIYLPLARHWKMPITEIKKIVKGERDV